MKTFLTGIITGAIMLFTNMIIGMGFHILFPGIQHEYENQQLFRPWSDPMMSLMYLHPFLVGVILAWIWGHIKELIPGTFIGKGLRFGLVYWLISVPGMLISYATFPVSLTLIFSWTIGILGQALIAGIVFSRFLR